jgi:tripartite-type tricarboxylate transporter receptor subunit TctC
MFRVTLSLLLLSLLAPATSPVRAQDYPTRPITLVVPFPPGGGVDLMARLVAGKLEQRLGQTFVIENKPGAGSLIAASHVLKSNPDGYTLLMAPSPTMAVNVSIYKKLPYDPVTDFVPLALLSGTPFVLMVKLDLPVKSVPELIAYAKANPGTLTFGSVGPGVPHHLFMELFKGMTGVQATYVPYRGSLPAVNDLAAGHIPMMFCDIGPAAGLLAGKRVRPLGISTKTRHRNYPDIPPLNEAGVPGFDAVSWQMMVAPAKTPRPIVDKLHAELKVVLAMPEVQDRIYGMGFLPLESRGVEDLKAFVKSEIARWGDVVQKAGIAKSL